MPSPKQRIQEAATRLGFDRVGVCASTAEPELARFQSWLEQGYDGCMHYLADRRDAYSDPNLVLQGVRSIVMLAIDYGNEPPAFAGIDLQQRRREGLGQVSRYAWGEQDYHDVIHRQLKLLKRELEQAYPKTSFRGVVDTAPLLERDYARLAGLGWIGKNTMLIDRDAGSWFFLAALLTDLELEPDPAFITDHCGTCRACLDACPTDAFPEPYVLDATRCISYLTIELRDEPPPVELRAGVGEWAFGCDVCQDVCPWNRRSAVSTQPAYQPRADMNPLALRELFVMSDEDFRDRFRRTPLWRSKRSGLLRNAAIVLGNQADPRSTSALQRGLREEASDVRQVCAWALGRIRIAGDSTARAALEEQLSVETDRNVRLEIEAALKG